MNCTVTGTRSNMMSQPTILMVGKVFHAHKEFAELERLAKVQVHPFLHPWWNGTQLISQ